MVDDEDVVDSGSDELQLSSDEEDDYELVSCCFLERFGVADFLSLAVFGFVLLVAAKCGLARLGPQARVLSFFML